jgi:organic radical activating enzyme
MITLSHAEVIWRLNGYCKFQCSYCPAESKSGGLDKSVDQYLAVIGKLQATRYQHHDKVHWKLGGGEPLHYPHLSTLLKKIKEKPSQVTLETSGDDTWFGIYPILDLIDRLELTYHPWQNDDVFDFIFEESQDRNIQIAITVPLEPGAITESRQRVQRFRDLGYECQEQMLHDADGEPHREYSMIDVNRIYGRPDLWEDDAEPLLPNQADPNYVNLAIVNSVDPVYTGEPCYAGVDWMEINARGFVSYSQCGGRNEPKNVFDPDWQPPNSHFPCSMNQCRSTQDRAKIRIADN